MSSGTVHPAARAMLVGAAFGGGTSVARDWAARRSGELSGEAMVSNMVRDAARTGLVSGAVTYTAEKVGDRPWVSMVALIGGAAAGLYLADRYLQGKNDDTAESES